MTTALRGDIRPPTNLELEMTVLGAIIANSRAYEDASTAGLKPHHFADLAHQRIYEAIEATIAVSDSRSLIVRVAHAVMSLPDVMFDGGAKRYVAELAASAWNMVDVRDLSAQIVDLYRRRLVMDWARELAADASVVDPELPADTLVERALQALDSDMAGSRSNDGPLHISAAVQGALDASEQARKSGSHVIGVPTGFRDLDELMGGMGGGELVILAGRPGMGKSSLGWGIAEKAAAAGVPVLFITMEMSSLALGRRAIAGRTGVGVSRLRRGRYDQRDIGAIAQAQGELSRLPVWIEHRPGITPAEVRMTAMRAKRRHGIGLIIVDHIGIMSAGIRDSNRTAQITAITGGLKGTAMALDIPVLALSQLNRGVEQREDKRPMLSDLRDSGSIEQDADAVLFLYREHYYLSRSRPVKSGESDNDYAQKLTNWDDECRRTEHLAEVSAAKLRDGEPGTVQLYWDGQRTAFGDLDTQHGTEVPF